MCCVVEVRISAGPAAGHDPVISARGAEPAYPHERRHAHRIRDAAIGALIDVLDRHHDAVNQRAARQGTVCCVRICRGSRWVTRVMLPIQCVDQGAFDSTTDALNVAEFKWVCRVGTLTPGGHNLVMPSYWVSQDQEFY